MSQNFFEVKNGLTFPGLAADPVSASNGDIYYNTTTGRHRRYLNGNWGDLSAGFGLTSLDLRLTNRLELSTYQALTPNIIQNDQGTKLQSTTGTLESNDLLLGVGQNAVSVALLDAEFSAKGIDINTVEAQIAYDLTAIDPNPTIEISRDGGATYFSMGATKKTGDDSWIGTYTFLGTEAVQTIQTYALANADTTIEFNVTTQQALSQGIILASANVIQRVTAYINKTGSPLGQFYFNIVKDDGTGKPAVGAQNILWQSAGQLASALSAGVNTVVITMPNLPLAPGTYHLVVTTDGTYKTNFSAGVNSIGLRVDNSAPTATGIGNTFNGTVYANATWDACYLIEGRTLDLRLRITSSAAGTKLLGYGVFYDKGVDPTAGRANRYEVVFDGATNPNSFDLTAAGFLPDAGLLFAVWTNTGQMFVSPAFDISGYTVQFATNQFASTGTQRLVFWQPFGNSFDNNEKNAALLAENRLGSTIPGVDRSIAGQGILLRASNGLLVEASILWNGSNYVWQFATVP